MADKIKQNQLIISGLSVEEMWWGVGEDGEEEIE